MSILHDSRGVFKGQAPALPFGRRLAAKRLPITSELGV
jgi:hypothetical protein